MKVKQIMFMKIFMRIKTCLILVVIYKIQRILILSIKKAIDKMKDEVEGKIISQFVGLKSKTYLLIDVDGDDIERRRIQ